MALKDKAKKSTSKGALAQKAQTNGISTPEKTPEAQMAEKTSLPSVTGQAPTPPPSLMYLRLFSQIPALRNKTGVQ